MLHSNINERQRWKWYIWVAMLHSNINERQSWYIIYADTVYIGIAGWRQEVQRNTTEKYRRMQKKINVVAVYNMKLQYIYMGLGNVM